MYRAKLTASLSYSQGTEKLLFQTFKEIIAGGNKEASIGNDLVGNFMESLTRLFKEPQRRINLGLIYGYEAPENHIQLCDGQQRMTTLFLLLGLLNKKTKENLFRQYLISDYEYLQDDKEPYLLYAIRESSLYFLSDLVCNFFIETKAVNSIEKVEDIKKATWFFNEYNNDPSIQSMLKALSVLENKLSGQTDEWCSNFGYFLIEKLSFLYYDLENRNNGEETFVVINTTGEPLSATQNLKPLVINAKINENYERNQGKKMEMIRRMLGLKKFYVGLLLLKLTIKKNKNLYFQVGSMIFPTKKSLLMMYIDIGK